MKINQEELRKFVSEVLKEGTDSEANEMFHMNNYTFDQNEDGYEIKFTIPGADKNDISIKVNNGIIFIEVKKSDLFKGLKDAIGVPVNMDMNNISSAYKNGVLIIKMPSIIKSEKEAVEITIE